jgi:hypothetical protein
MLGFSLPSYSQAAKVVVPTVGTFNDPVLYRNSSRYLSNDCGMMRRFGWRDLIWKLGQHWVFSPSVIVP